MATFRIHRLREAARTSFRWAPHTAGATTIKPKDYEADGEVEASTPYAAWMLLKESEQKLHPGDVLELQDGSLRIYKFVGFEEAHWLVPEVKTADSLPTISEAPPANA